MTDEDPRIRRWREAEEERERKHLRRRWRRPAPKDTAQALASHQRAILYPGITRLTASWWRNPVLWIAGMIVVLEMFVFALGTWQVALSEDGWSILVRNPVRMAVVEDFAFHPVRSENRRAVLRAINYIVPCPPAGSPRLARYEDDHPCSILVREREALPRLGVFEELDARGLVTAIFLHANPWHMALNMLAFLLLAPFVAARTGPVRFVALFLAAGIVGNFAYWAFAGLTWAGVPLFGHDPFRPVVGASGAIFGMFAVFLRWQWRTERSQKRAWTAFGPTPWLLRGQWQIVGLNVLFGFIGTWAWEAHLGGFVAGWLLEPYLRRPPTEFRSALARANRPARGTAQSSSTA